MVTLRGQWGIVTRGGHLFSGSLVVDGVVPNGETLVSLRAGSVPLRAVVAPGDTFTVAGVAGTYTVVSLPTASDPHQVRRWAAALNRIPSVTFTPAAPVGGFPDGAAVTMSTHILGQVQLWRSVAQFQILETTVMGNVARGRRTGRATREVIVEGLFDYGDPEQAAFLNEFKNAGTAYCFLTLGNTELPVRGFPWTEPCNEIGTGYRPFWLYESCLLSRAVVVSQHGDLVRYRFDAVSHTRRPTFSWQEDCELYGGGLDPLWIEMCEYSQGPFVPVELWTEPCEEAA